MTVTSVINAIFHFCLVPILIILVKSLTTFFNKEKEVTIKNSKDKAVRHAMDLLSDIVVECVTATNQTYVNALKEIGEFDAEAQKKALQITKDAILDIVSDELKERVEEAVGDLNTYLNRKIESVVSTVKKIGQN